MRCADFSGGYKRPFRIEPEVGQVGEYSAACPQNRLVSAVSHAPRARFQVAIGSKGQQSPHVLKHDQRRSQRVDGAGHVRPHACPVALPQPGAAAGAGHVLAGKPGRQHVNGLNLIPSRRCYIAQIGHGREAVSEDGRRARINVRHPCELAAEHLMNGAIEAAVT